VIHWNQLGRALRPISHFGAELGYFTSSGFEHWYNEALAHKLNKNKTITFGDIDFDLRIVSADLRTSDIVVHSKKDSPNLSVAAAVAASISIPIVFEPKKIGQGMHVDGGVLSNFPAWLFVQDTAEQPIPVLGFELVDSQDTLPADPDLFSYLQGLLATAVAGKKGIERRGIQNIHSVSIPVSTGTFDFDPSIEVRQQTYAEGLTAAREFFPRELKLVTQEQMAPFLYEVHRTVIEHIGRPVHLRINVMDQNSLGHLSIRYHFNMDFDSDDRMDLPLDAGGAGHCYTAKKPRLVDLDRAKREFSSFKMTKYQQALVRSSLRSLLSVPLFMPGWAGDDSQRPVIGVLNFDSDDLSVDELEKLSDLAIDMAANISQVWVVVAKHGEIS
jgi:NTE family protein